MLQQRIYQNRADRVIAIGRAALAGFAAVAINIDPPTITAFHTDVVIELYFIASVIFAFVVTWRPATAPPLGTFAMASDVVVFSSLVYISANQSSPFFPMLLFIILSATLKWQWRGAAIVGAIVFLLFLPSGLTLQFFGPTPANQTMRFVMRAGNLLVMSALLVFFGRQREGVWAELLRLSAPISGRAGPAGLPVAACLSHAADFFKAGRAMLVWRSDDGGVEGAEWRDGRLTPIPVDAAVRFIDGPAAASVQFDDDGSRLFVDGGRATSDGDALLPPAARAAWGLTSGVAASLHGEQLSGWLIVPGAKRAEDLYLARAVAAQIGVALDRAGADRAWREAASGEERVRLARDLHDGILQFLTGLALQLRIIERESPSDPAMKKRIELLQTTLVAEQTELRQFVQGMSVAANDAGDAVSDLRRLARLLAHHWDIEIAVSFEDGFDTGEIGSDVRQIVREAVANAVRHGGATRVEIRGRVDADGIGLDISDNGAGLERRGRFDLRRMADEAIGPKSLRSRVAGLGGALTADSRATGLTLAIDLPMRWREAAE